MATYSPAGYFLLFGSPAMLSPFAAGAPLRHAKMTVAAGEGWSGSGRVTVAVAAGAAVPGGSVMLSLFAAGAPPRHAKMTVAAGEGWPGSCKKGGGVTVAVAAGATVPGGSALSLFAAGAPLRHAKTMPASFLVSSSGRLSVVAASARAASSGESPSEDCEGTLSAFRLEMELFKISQRPVALVGNPSDLLMEGAFGTARDSSEMMEFLLAKVPVHGDVLKELITVGQGFLTVELQAKEGYVKADALANVIQGLKLVGNTFFPGVNLPPDYYAPVVPLSADDVDKESFFTELINIFIVFYTALYWESRGKYGFRSTGGN